MIQSYSRDYRGKLLLLYNYSDPDIMGLRV